MAGLGFLGRSWADYDLLIGRLLQRKGIVTGEQVDAGLVIQRREMDRGRPTRWAGFSWPRATPRSPRWSKPSTTITACRWNP